MEDYKQEIEATRIGCLGSSDAKMVAMIEQLGSVPKSAYERLAIVKGIKEKGDSVYTPAMQFGDRMENEIFEYLKESGKPYQSNPLWESKKYSRKHVKCISHPDYVLVDEAQKMIYVYEVKTSKHPTPQVRQEYRCQLFWHYQLALEQAMQRGKEWRHKVFLVHYNASGIEDFDGHEFDIQRLSIKEARFQMPIFDIAKGMDIIDEFLTTFDEYFESEEIDADMLPQNVYQQFLSVCESLAKIKEMEDCVETFKKRIYEYMCAKDIKSIKNDYFSISRIDPAESVSFDFKRYLDDLAKAHPTKAKRIKHQYEKRVQRKGYAVIKVKK